MVSSAGASQDAAAARFAGRDELVGGKETAGAYLRELDAGVGQRGAGFMPEHVALAAYQDIVAWPREQSEGGLVLLWFSSAAVGRPPCRAARPRAPGER